MSVISLTPMLPPPAACFRCGAPALLVHSTPECESVRLYCMHHFMSLGDVSPGSSTRRITPSPQDSVRPLLAVGWKHRERAAGEDGLSDALEHHTL